MNLKNKEKGSKPIQLIKALFQCTLLFCIPGLFITFFSPSFTIELTRVSQERVDAIVVKKLLLIVPIFKYTANNIVDINIETIDGGLIRKGGSAASSTGKVIGKVEDEGLLLLRGAGNERIEVWVSPKNLYDVWEEVQYFVTEGKAPSLRLWVISNWKFGVILPGGILLLCSIIFFMASWSIITGKSFESKGARS